MIVTIICKKRGEIQKKKKSEFAKYRALEEGERRE